MIVYLFILLFTSLLLLISSQNQTHNITHADEKNLNGSIFKIQERISPNFPHGRDKENRVAICLNGQLRSANLTWDRVLQNQHRKMFGKDDPPTTAATIVENMFRPIAHDHGLDVYMYLTAHPEHDGSSWDGRPESFEPSVGNPFACNVFSNNDIFNNTGNRFFCLIEPEVELMNPFVKHFAMWSNYTYNSRDGFNEQVLQQLYALYRSNLAAKQYAIANQIHYKYKLRVRPDTAVVKPFPSLSTIPFEAPNGRNCKRNIYFANKVIYKNGNEDWFNIGYAEDMDKLLDRFVDLTSSYFIHNSPHYYWDLENHLLGLMEYRYKICMNWYFDIWMVVIRKQFHTMNSWKPPKNNNQWSELSL